MSLPPHNPIDAGWFRKGVPLDHLGTNQRYCECCGQPTAQEHFRAVAGSSFGLGSPVFMQPFLKRQSTRGKFGGVKGEIFQCTVCDSLWPDGASGERLLIAAEFPAAGVISPRLVADYEKRIAREIEAREAKPEDIPASKVRKIRD